MIEIRMDRRQAFYAFVGCMLIVSVAFVVGLIVGQRMQVPSGDSADQLSSDGPAGPLLPVAVAIEEPPEPEPEPFTFFDELGSGASRQTSEHTPATDRLEESGAAGVRVLERQAEAAAEELAAVDDSPPPEPPSSVPEPPAREESHHQTRAAERAEAGRSSPREEGPPVADRGEDDSSGETRALARRTVRRVQAQEVESGPEDFGYYTVEAGLYTSFDEADALRRRLGDRGHDAIVTLLSGAEGRRYRVQIGSFTRRSDAEEVAEAVSVFGVRARVVQEG